MVLHAKWLLTCRHFRLIQLQMVLFFALIRSNGPFSTLRCFTSGSDMNPGSCFKDRILLLTQSCPLFGWVARLVVAARTQPCVSLLLTEFGWCLDESGGMALGGRWTVKRDRVGPGQERSGLSRTFDGN